MASSSTEAIVSRMRMKHFMQATVFPVVQTCRVNNWSLETTAPTRNNICSQQSFLWCKCYGKSRKAVLPVSQRIQFIVITGLDRVVFVIFLIIIFLALAYQKIAETFSPDIAKIQADSEIPSLAK